ncbi:MAG: alpha/beta hydrolase family protein [Alphaproteobacteria bacterium]
MKRLFDPVFRASALGVGPDVPAWRRLWRWVQYGFFYTPLSRWTFRVIDAVKPAVIAPDHLYPHEGAQGELVEDEGQLFDESRGIGVAYFSQRLATPEGPVPVIIYSIPMDWGPGRRPGSITYLREAIVRAGYFLIRIQHMESDAQIIDPDFMKGKDPTREMAKAVADPSRAHNRFLDISFVIDELTRWNAPGGRLEGQLDLGRIGLCGHSYGARTLLALAGRHEAAHQANYKDARVRAGISYSVTQIDGSCPDEDFAAIDIPIMHMGGTRDIAWSNPSLMADRFWAYEKSSAADQYKLIMNRIDHVAFTGGRGDASKARDLELAAYRFIRAATLAFWDAHLRADVPAQRWLKTEFPRILGRAGRLSWK